MMFWQNLRFALRSLRSNPGYTAAAVIALAIGIGLNTAMFSVVDGILLKPLAFPNPHELLTLREDILTPGTTSRYPFAAGNLYDYRAQIKSVSIVAYGLSPFSLILPNSDPERYYGVTVTEGWFRLYGAKFVRGRDFTAEDFVPGKDQAVIISSGLWRDRFAADNSIIGREINLNGRPRVVVGVVDAAYEYPNKAKIWAPLVLEGVDRSRRDFHAYLAQGRLRPNFTLEQARAEFSTVLANLARQFPQYNENKRIFIEPLVEESTGRVRPALVALVGAVTFVLAIACANVANLVLARGAARKGEFAVRTALGATRFQLISQMLTESLLLSAAGGILGLVLAVIAFFTFKIYAPQNLPRLEQIVIDFRVLAYNLGAVFVSGALFGLIPAIRMSRTDLQETLKDKTRGGSSRTHFRNLLVVGQVAAALMLMTGAGLLIRSLYQLSQVDLGFQPDHLITMRVTPLPTKYNGEIDRQVQFGRDITRNLATIPGLLGYGISTDVPLQGTTVRFHIRVEGRPLQTAATAPVADYFTVSPTYFDVMKIPLQQGRRFNDNDTRSSPRVLIISEEFARIHFPNENPIGKRVEIGLSDPPEWREVVGLVKNVKNNGIDKGIRAQVYAPFFQVPSIVHTQAASISVIARTSGDPALAAQAVRAKILEADSSQPVWQIQTMEESVNNSISRERFTLFLMAVFAGVAFLLAIIGLSGVVSYTVTQRTREIGIRMAIGAKPIEVLWMIEKHALLLVASGIAGGMIGSILIARALSVLLFNVSPYDPLTLSLIALIFLVTALLSGLVPARRAARIDPAVTLRAE
ncbi:ABC transporter permease [Bryobacter aggregatus]|uniref:ABC transporter permease n=1 Tax=Bryobacter aggregatus TaxID=360054 RepID=UPI0004E179B1|nr:ABC transporter permease [Bryobacter aggregatus]